MKKTFRLIAAFAVACAALFSTGCEELQTELDTVKKDVKSLSSDFTTQAQQVTALENAVKALQTTSDALAKKGEANAAAIAACSDAISELQAVLQGVVDTYATKEALETASEALGKAYKAADDELKVSIDANAKAIQGALGEIESIKKNFDNYYTIAQVDSAKADMRKQMRTISAAVVAEIAARQAAIEGVEIAYKAAIAAVQKSHKHDIDSLCAALNSAKEDILANKKSIEKEIEDRTAACKQLQDNIDALKAQIFGVLGSRVNSIAVYPSGLPELVHFYLNERDAAKAAMLQMTFEVKPASAAAEIANRFKNDTTGNCFKVNYVFAPTRSSSPLEYQEEYQAGYAKIVSLEEGTGGQVLVTAQIPSLRKADTAVARIMAKYRQMRYFISATYFGKDDAGVYSIGSEYVEATETSDETPFAEYVRFATPAGAIVKDSVAFVGPTESINYVKADTATRKPFSQYSLVVAPTGSLKRFFPDSTYTPEAFSQRAGVQLVAIPGVILVQEPIYTKKAAQFETEIGFKGNLSKYVDGKARTFTLRATVNGENTDYSLNQSYELTNFSHDIKNVDVTLRWNYKHYTDAARKDSVKVESAFKNGMKLNEAGTFGKKVIFSDNKKDSFILTGNSLAADGETVIDTVKYGSVSDTAYFKVSVTVEPKLKAYSTSKDTTITGTVSKNRTVYIVDFAKTFVAANKTALLSGLSDREEDVIKAVKARITKGNLEVKFASATLDSAGKGYWYSPVSDVLFYTIPENKVGYSTSYDFSAKIKDVFGQSYTYSRKITVGAPKFSFKLFDQAKDNSYKVRGYFDANDSYKYKIQTLDYTTQVYFDKIDFSCEEDEILVKFTASPAGTENPGEKGIAITKSTGRLVNGSYIGWGNVNATSIDMKATAWFNNYESPVSISYKLVTDDPVKYDEAAISTQTYTKAPGDSMKIFLAKPYKFYGLNPTSGEYDKTTRLTHDGLTGARTLQGARYDFEWKAKGIDAKTGKLNSLKVYINGSSTPTTYYEGTDYVWTWESDKNGSTFPVITFIKDDQVGYYLTFDVDFLYVNYCLSGTAGKAAPKYTVRINF